MIVCIYGIISESRPPRPRHESNCYSEGMGLIEESQITLFLGIVGLKVLLSFLSYEFQKLLLCCQTQIVMKYVTVISAPGLE